MNVIAKNSLLKELKESHFFHSTPVSQCGVVVVICLH
jgi:hypothetical protein